jgi:predicted RNA-binding Zn-ribbon protein involved in translation (DUF1610 family)
MIDIVCPNCGAKLQTPDDAVGSMVKCPECATPITVHEPIYDAEAMPDAASPASAPAAAAAEGEERRPCPMCGEMIVASAAKCRYCGEVFDPTLRKAEAAQRGRTGRPEDEDMSTGDWAVAILCSGIGCILGLVWMIQGKRKGLKMFLISFVVNIAFGLVRFMIEQAKQP